MGAFHALVRGRQGIPKYDPNMILHGEQALELLKPLPVEGDFVLKSKVIGVWDKGTGGDRASRGAPGLGSKCALRPCDACARVLLNATAH